MLTGYYQKSKEMLSKKARERYQNFSEEEKDKKCQYARERYRNLSEEEKEKKHQYGSERYNKGYFIKKFFCIFILLNIK